MTHGNDKGVATFAHVLSPRLLLGVLAALLGLTVITVAVNWQHLGTELGFITGMVIATMKGALVLLYFMHLRWEKATSVIFFTGAFLFVLLFLSFAIADRSEYQGDIDRFEDAKARKP